ncbi:TRAP transporter substrate-binding protein [Alkalihalobacillus oceani]|uniref:TRAP transporter substrate-binding protein n=1 Tax=Halalkalibacter oceani TaxID=1653776 RepID=A0A9X2INS6_9BACI|nr:TRAP transporter substrate-binding protein [Halalkalibacter oceani]MCM3714515.1 TRAP transporter substrate-binding protein [Halalkalibacter oceani]
MKKLLMLAMLAMMVAIVAACGGGSDSEGTDTSGEESSGETITLKVGHTLADTSHYQEGLEYFKEILAEKTDGRMDVEIFPNGSLGGERDMVEGLQIGSVDLVLTSTGPMSGFVEEITVVDLPFLFRDAEHAHTVLDGEVGQDLLAKLEGIDLKGLAWWENGFRNVTNNTRPVEKPEDLQGLKLRTMENDIHMAAFRELGADPTPMAFTELFTAMQQGVVDGNENPIPVIYSSRFYEVQDYLTMTRHFYNPSILLTSNSFFNNLEPELQTALQEAAVEAGIFEREVVQRMDEEYLNELEEQGMEVIREIDVEPFIEAVQPVYDQYSEVFGQELIDSIKNQ